MGNDLPVFLLIEGNQIVDACFPTIGDDREALEEFASRVSR